MSLLSLALLGSTIVSSVSAHGHVQGIVAGGKWYAGYTFTNQYENPVPKSIGWSTPEVTDNGFVDPDNYTNSAIICHIGATPAPISAPVKAGGTVELQWTPWPSSHHGPVLNYLAKCPGKCADANPETLEFFKFDQGGLVNDATPPGTWASDQLIAKNNSWTVTIPKTLASGNYVLRHEIIALHSAETANGAQNYPQCINLEVSGGGSEKPSGEPATKFYKPTDPGILIDIYEAISKYVIPGPKLFSGASSSISESASSAPAPGSSAASSAAASSPSSGATSSAATSSAPAAMSSSPASSAWPTSSAPAGSSAKCTTTITVRSSAAASTPVSSVGAVSGTSVVPAGSSTPSGPASTGGFSMPWPTGTSAPWPTTSSVGATSVMSSATPSAPVPSSPPAAPSSYPTPPPSGGEPAWETLMSNIINYIKMSFRKAEHAKDFRKF